jgi:hypothetical protein
MDAEEWKALETPEPSEQIIVVLRGGVAQWQDQHPPS